jgi:hypothetical protein
VRNLKKFISLGNGMTVDVFKLGKSCAEVGVLDLVVLIIVR